MNRPHIIKVDLKNPVIKNIKKNTIARVHGRRLVSALMFRDLLKITDREPSRKIRMAKDGVVITVSGPGFQTKNVLKYLEIPERGGLHYLKLDLYGPDRSEPFVKFASSK